MNKELILAIEALEKENGIDKEIMFDAIEKSLMDEYKAEFDKADNGRVVLDRRTGDFHIYSDRTVVEEVEVPGGGTAYVNVINEVAKLTSDIQDEQVGINIIVRSLEEPMRQIAHNAGLEGSVIIEKVKNSDAGVGFDALRGEYKDMIKAGIVDPTKVTRSALQNAASVASTFLTTEAAVADIPEKEMPQGAGMGMDGMY